MSRSIALVCMMLIVSLTTRNAYAVRYVVEPVALSDGYAITGGFIETNTVGPLTAGDITDYLFTVEGEVPYVFSPSNQFSISTHGTVLATEGQVMLPAVPAGSAFGVHNDISITSRFDTDRGYANLSYATGYDILLSPSIKYDHSGIPDVDGDPFRLSRPRMNVPDHTTIVVATVPEPATATLMISCGVVVLFRARVRRTEIIAPGI